MIGTVFYMGGKKEIGQWGENLAVRFLETHGFLVVEKNYHTPVGELDLIARRGSEWYGVEVKTRELGKFDNDLAITNEKKRRLFKTLKKYCYERRIDSEEVFLAGIIIGFDRINKKAKIRWVLIY